MTSAAGAGALNEVEDSSPRLETAKVGMWIFLAMEILFFSAIFFLFFAERHSYPEAWRLGSAHLEKGLAAWNTAVLLTSSLAMAVSVEFARKQEKLRCLLSLGVTSILGFTFLGLKLVEYDRDFEHALLPAFRYQPSFAAPKELELFVALYFLVTLIHFAHLLIGASLVGLNVCRYARSRRVIPIVEVEVVGLYWHFVDVIWVLIFAVFYLLGKS